MKLKHKTLKQTKSAAFEAKVKAALDSAPSVGTLTITPFDSINLVRFTPAPGFGDAFWMGPQGQIGLYNPVNQKMTFFGFKRDGDDLVMIDSGHTIGDPGLIEALEFEEWNKDVDATKDGVTPPANDNGAVS